MRALPTASALLSDPRPLGFSQMEFARALGVSKRTLENWEQGRAQPTGAARQLLRLAAQFPDTVGRLATMGHEVQFRSSGLRCGNLGAGAAWSWCRSAPR
ncbi:helix-turn-helix domain-containing protein [Halochromatium roseum]|uniref:helix-turn-helix domain-containing protein n=1 Tax=Halochromatium roseum TaxID=391920 RepID=UPI0019147BDE|nr:helix-turn-helix domain-containing protein [Halochromatium roseum]